jgi:hypothetical protein
MPIVLTPIVNTTQTIAFDAMVDDISAFLPGCPSPTISRTAKKIVVDLCQRGKVWHEDFIPAPMPVGQLSYPLLPPVPHAECTDVTAGYIVIGDQKRDLVWQQLSAVRRRFPNWPDNELGQPQYMTWATIGELLLAPVPDEAGTLYLRGYLRPTAAATVWDLDLYHEFQRVIFHGTLHELMMMPNRSWSDDKTAVFHGRQWTQLLSAAKDRAVRGFNTADLSVEMRPFA